MSHHGHNGMSGMQLASLLMACHHVLHRVTLLWLLTPGAMLEMHAAEFLSNFTTALKPASLMMLQLQQPSGDPATTVSGMHTGFVNLLTMSSQSIAQQTCPLVLLVARSIIIHECIAAYWTLPAHLTLTVSIK